MNAFDRRLARQIAQLLRANVGAAVTFFDLLTIGQHEDLAYYVLAKRPGVGAERDRFEFERGFGADLALAVRTFIKLRHEKMLGYDFECVCPSCQGALRFATIRPRPGRAPRPLLVCRPCRR